MMILKHITENNSCDFAYLKCKMIAQKLDTTEAFVRVLAHVD